MKIWLDDVRIMPDGFDRHVRSAAEAIGLLVRGRVTAISLDYDLGDSRYGTGYDVACWIRKAACEGRLAPIAISIHSADPEGCALMEEAIAEAKRCWSDTING